MNPLQPVVLSPLLAAVLIAAASSPAQVVSTSLPVVVDQGEFQRIEINPGMIPGTIVPESSSPDHITAFGNKVLFRAWMGQARGHELWISDGTAAGTQRFVDLEPGGPDDVRGHIAVLNGKAFFSARNPGDGIELWVTDGVTTQPFMNLDGGPGDSYPEYLTRIGQRIFFAAEDAEGAEPWVTDGTVAGTRRLMNINTQPHFLPTRTDSGSNPRYFAGYPLAVVFQADDGVHGRELWFTDGNSDTRLLKDIYPNNLGVEFGSVPEYMTAAHPVLASERYVVFSADTSVEINGVPQKRRFPWVTDFTPEGTQALFSGYNVQPSDFVNVGHSAYFAGWVINSNPPFADWGIWLTDGTPGGTRPVFHKIGDSGLIRNQHLTMGGDRYLYMSSDIRVPESTGTQLVRIDVKDGTTFGLFELDAAGSGLPSNTAAGHEVTGARGDRKPFAVAGNKLFMAASVFDPASFRLDTELVIANNGGTSKVEDWGCGSVWLYATDPLIDPMLAASTITFTGNSTIPNAINQVWVSKPSPSGPAPLSSVFGPFPGLILTGCQFYLDPSTMPILLPPSTGNWYSNIVTVPNAPRLLGLEFMAQMLTLSTGPIPTVLASNPVRMTMGH